MLRKDMAWPNGTEDAAAITQRGKRRVTLTAHMARFVSVARWESFGWKVLGADYFPYLEAARDEGLL
jgi:hypothetical protein